MTFQKGHKLNIGKNNPMYGKKVKDFHKSNCQCRACKSMVGIYKNKTYEELYGNEKAQIIKNKIGKKGEDNPNFGKKLKDFHKTNCKCFYCKVTRGEFKGENNPMFGNTGTHIEKYGVEKAMEIGKKISISKKGKSNSLKGKSYEKIHGKEKADDLKQKRIKSNTGREVSDITRHKISKGNTGKKISEQTRRKMRISKQNYFKELGPREGKYESQILDELEQLYGYKIIRQFVACGYFVDGYIPQLNLCIEVDEPHHFNVDGNISEEDTIRQKNIEEELNCKFLRIKESKYLERIKK